MKNIIPEKTILLIDGSSFLYRAYYGIRPLHTTSGVAVGAVFGFCRMIKKLLDMYTPQYCILVWDSKGKTARHEIFEAYKATRQAPPNDLFAQKKLIQEFAELIGMHQIAKQGVEADDLLYSLAHDFSKQGFDCILVTSDKDMGQILDEHTTMYDSFKEELFTRQKLEEKYGFSLDKLPFYFALVGDASDNIPGVAGIGPKGALALVQQFASLEDLYAHLDQVLKERIRELLKISRDNAFLSEQLFTLRYYDLGCRVENAAFAISQWVGARPLFERYNFKSLLKDLPILPSQSIALTLADGIGNNFKTITKLVELQQLCAKIMQIGECAVDTETSSLDPFSGHLVGVSLCCREGEAFYIPLCHETGEEQVGRSEAIAALKLVLEDQKIKKYLQNSKFDQLFLHIAGIELQGLVFDTMIAAGLVSQASDTKRLGLKALSEIYLHESMTSYTDVVSKNGYKNFAQLPIDIATQYAAADAHQTYKLFKILEQELVIHEQVKLFYELEMPLVSILYEMELAGIYCDIAVLDALDMRVIQALEAIRAEIITLIGEHNWAINLNSPKQLEHLLFTELQLKPGKRTTQRTSYSTDQEVLEELAREHPVPALILKNRELFKLKSTYIDGLKSHIAPYDGKIHTSFSQIAVATGRLASSEPNLQNIPVPESESGVINIRAAFKAPPGYQFLSADYSQIELRVLAYLSQDAQLIDAFLQNKDIHAITASGIFGVPVDKVTSAERQVGKRINFSVLYGITPYGLSKDLHISYAQAQTYIERYFAQYPGVSAWMANVVETTKKQGYVTTSWGRRRYIPGIYEKNKSLFDLAQRIAINTCGQGTAAELMKKGMLDVHVALKKENFQSHMLLQIHDELLLVCPEHEVVQVQQLVQAVLSQVVVWNVPLVITTRVGADWEAVSK